MQDTIAVLFDAFERIEGMVSTGHGFGNFTGSRFDFAAMRRHQQNSGITVTVPDDIIKALLRMLSKVAEMTVSIHDDTLPGVGKGVFF